MGVAAAAAASWGDGEGAAAAVVVVRCQSCRMFIYILLFSKSHFKRPKHFHYITELKSKTLHT